MSSDSELWNRNDDEAMRTTELHETLHLMDQEMKDETATKPSQPELQHGSAPGNVTTWSFVQMNMSLLPIARPLPVSISNRFHEGVGGRKPRTPNQKLHHHVVHNASNISPRRHDIELLPRRTSTVSSIDTSYVNTRGIRERVACTLRPTSAPIGIPGRCGKRKAVYDSDEDHCRSSSWQAGDNSTCSEEEDTQRSRSRSVDVTMDDVDYWNECPRSLQQHIQKQLNGDGLPLSRSASASSTFAQQLFRGKRILELQDEERRMAPDERASCSSPSKRLKHA